MPAVVILAVLAAAGLPHLLPRLRGKDGRDAPARIVAVAAGRLPAGWRDWGQAMAAELAQVRGRASRWQFAAPLHQKRRARSGNEPCRGPRGRGGEPLPRSVTPHRFHGPRSARDDATVIRKWCARGDKSRSAAQ